MQVRSESMLYFQAFSKNPVVLEFLIVDRIIDRSLLRTKNLEEPMTHTPRLHSGAMVTAARMLNFNSNPRSPLIDCLIDCIQILFKIIFKYIFWINFAFLMYFDDELINAKYLHKK